MRLSLGVALLLVACVLCARASVLDNYVAELAPRTESRFRATMFAISCFYNLSNLPAWVVAMVVISVLTSCTGIVLIIVGFSRLVKANRMEDATPPRKKSDGPTPAIIGGSLLLSLGLILLATALGITIRSTPMVANRP